MLLLLSRVARGRFVEPTSAVPLVGRVSKICCRTEHSRTRMRSIVSTIDRSIAGLRNFFDRAYSGSRRRAAALTGARRNRRARRGLSNSNIGQDIRGARWFQEFAPVRLGLIHRPQPDRRRRTHSRLREGPRLSARGHHWARNRRCPCGSPAGERDVIRTSAAFLTVIRHVLTWFHRPGDQAPSGCRDQATRGLPFACCSTATRCRCGSSTIATMKFIAVNDRRRGALRL